MLDASAILAWLQREPGGAFVTELLLGQDTRVSISAVNFCEVITKLSRDGLSSEDAQNAVQQLEEYVRVFDGEQAMIAGELSSTTRHHGLSLGDRACLALALKRSASVWTTDRVWHNLKVGVTVRLLRGKNQGS